MWSLKGCHFSDVVDQVPIITLCSFPFFFFLKVLDKGKKVSSGADAEDFFFFFF